MTHDDDLARLLSHAFDAKARASVSDDRPTPPLGLPDSNRSGGGRRWVARSAPLLAAAAVVLVAVGVAVTVSGTGRSPQRPGTVTDSHSMAGATASRSAAPTTPVRVSVNLSNGQQVGVGMPIIVTFPLKITDGSAFSRATRVTVNGSPVAGAWYFDYSGPASGHVMEAHYRTKDYWPAHARIHLELAVGGRPAGAGLSFANSVSLDFVTGAAQVATVDSSAHSLTVTSDGHQVGRFPVSLGAPQTPTMRGTKVIMAKQDHVCLDGPGYAECGIRYVQRLTYGGEYLLAAPWSAADLGRANTSGGSTDLSTADAQALYRVLQVGDVVTFPNADGAPMQFASGYGDWNVPWPVWLNGGVISTR